jgi:hypothetical protein
MADKEAVCVPATTTVYGDKDAPISATYVVQEAEHTVTRRYPARITVEPESESEVVKQINNETAVLEMAKWLVLNTDKEWRWIPDVNPDVLLKAVHYCLDHAPGSGFDITAKRLLRACIDRDTNRLDECQERTKQLRQSIATFEQTLDIFTADGPWILE